VVDAGTALFEQEVLLDCEEEPPPPDEPDEPASPPPGDAAVLPQVLGQEAAAAPTALPATGSSALTLALVALGVLLTGAVLAAASHRSGVGASPARR
jgi:hypothetical protein